MLRKFGLKFWSRVTGAAPGLVFITSLFSQFTRNDVVIFSLQYLLKIICFHLKFKIMLKAPVYFLTLKLSVL